MLILKLVAPAVTLVVAILQLLLSHRWRDQRTRKFKRGRLFLFLFLLMAAFSSGIIIYLDNESERNLTNQLDQIQLQNDSLKTLVTHIETEISKVNLSLEPFREIAVQRFGSLSEREALSQLASNVKRLGKRLEQELTSINTLETEVNIKIEANWLDSKPPNFPPMLMINGGSDTWIDVRNKAGKVRRLELFGSGTVPQITASDKAALIKYRRKAAAGSWIIGTDKTELVGSEGFQVWLYSINSSIVKDQMVVIVSIEIMFFVNGDYYCKLLLLPNRSKELTNKEGSRSILVRHSSNFSFASLSEIPK